MGRIPVATRTSSSSIPVSEKLHVRENTIVFSFAALEQTEYFNLSGTCEKWASDMLKMCKEISKLTVQELFSRKFRTYRFHSLDGASCPEKLPDGVELKDMYQIRISTAKGGIHGVFSENQFFVIWLDPLHNMYPDDRFGGLRKIPDSGSCCKDRDEEIARLNDLLQQKTEELEEVSSIANLYMEDLERLKSGQHTP